MIWLAARPCAAGLAAGPGGLSMGSIVGAGGCSAAAAWEPEARVGLAHGSSGL